MTKAEFSKLEQNKKINKTITASAVICYVCAGLTLVAFLFVPSLNGGLIDAVILLALGLIIQLRKSFPAAVILLVYAVLNMAIMFVQYHRFAGWLVLIAGIYAVMETSKLNKAWKVYQEQTAASKAAYADTSDTVQTAAADTAADSVEFEFDKPAETGIVEFPAEEE